MLSGHLSSSLKQLGQQPGRITAFCTPVRAELEPQLHVREVDRRFILGVDVLVLGLRIGLLMRLHDHRGLFERLCRSKASFSVWCPCCHLHRCDCHCIPMQPAWTQPAAQLTTVALVHAAGPQSHWPSYSHPAKHLPRMGCWAD